MKINAKNGSITLYSGELIAIQSYLEKCGAGLLRERQFKSLEHLNKIVDILHLDVNYTINLRKHVNGLVESDFVVYNDGTESYLKEKESISAEV